MNEHWDDCRAGEVRELVQRLKAQRRARSLRQSAAVTTVLALVLLGGAYYWGSAGAEADYGGIVCSDVMRHAERFMAGTLDATTADQIRRHIAHCPECRRRLAQMQNNSKSKSDRDAAGHSGGSVGPNGPVEDVTLSWLQF